MLKVLSYNIDGLNEHSIPYRTQVILGMILSQSPDVIQLQEVVRESFALLRSSLDANGYVCSGISPQFAHYFIMTALKKSRFSQHRFTLEEFRGAATSQQGRLLLVTRAKLDGAFDCLLVNCHLESTGAAFKSPESQTRVAQLQQGLHLLINHDPHGPSLLSGDLNIRDQEASYVLKGFPLHHDSHDSRIVDIAKVLQRGRSPLSPTWVMPGNPKVSWRFDRMYIPTDIPSIYPRWRVERLDVVGSDDIADEDDGAPYPTASDHRGLLATFHVPTIHDPTAASSTTTASATVASEIMAVASVDGKKRKAPVDEEYASPKKHTTKTTITSNRVIKDTKEDAEVIDLT
jgi:endonuclease/exonuclease/phosphatase family metal-dependent hydrolase